MNLVRHVRYATASSIFSSENIIAENVARSYVPHAVEIIGMCPAMLTKKCVCVTLAIKSGWLIKSVRIISIKHLSSLLILAIIRYSKQIRDQMYMFLNELRTIELY